MSSSTAVYFNRGDSNYQGATSGRVQNRAGGYGDDTDQAKMARVTLDVKVSPTLLVMRTGATKHVPREQVIGTLQQGYLDVVPGEPVFTKRGGDAVLSGNTSYAGENMNRGFSSFNGISVQGQTQEQFESQWQMVGFAWDGYVHGDPDQLESGITVLVGGSGSTYNTGTQVFAMGDWIFWRLSDVDYAQRALETGHAGRVPGGVVGKHTAILEPFNTATTRMAARNFGSGAARFLLQEATVAQLAVSRLRAGATRPPGKREHYALALKSLLMGGLHLGLTALAQGGMITVHAPRDPLRPGPNHYGKHRAVLDRALSSTMGGTQTVDYSGGQPVVRERSADEERQFKDGLVWLGAQLGLVDEGDHPHLPENTKLTHQVLGRQLSGACTHDSALNEEFSLARLFPGVRSRGTRSGYADSNPASHLVRHQQQYIGETEFAYANGFREMMTHVVGKATKPSVPGGVLDYVLV